jgi:septal ring factor EnvC (AmiA/AmiB activator)
VDKTFSVKISDKDLKKLNDHLDKLEGSTKIEKFSNLVEILCVRESERELSSNGIVSSPVLSHSPHGTQLEQQLVNLYKQRVELGEDIERKQKSIAKLEVKEAQKKRLLKALNNTIDSQTSKLESSEWTLDFSQVKDGLERMLYYFSGLQAGQGTEQIIDYLREYLDFIKDAQLFIEQQRKEYGKPQKMKIGGLRS